MSFDIKITPKGAPKVEGLAPTPAPVAIRVAVKPRANTAMLHEATLSTLAQDEHSRHRLTKAEAANEVRVAYAIIAEKLAALGVAVSNIRVTHNPRFTQRMGDARTISYDPANPTGVIRISSSPLWRRASPESRRTTVVHELAHVLANCEAKRCVGHGRAWKRKMLALGEKPARCHRVSTAGLKKRGARPVRVVNEGATVEEFHVGQAVSFYDRKDRNIVGVVISGGRSRVALRDANNPKCIWRVSPALLVKLPAIAVGRSAIAAAIASS